MKGNITLTAKWTKVSVKKVTIKKKQNIKGKKIKLTLKKLNGVKGYEIQYSTNKKFTKKTTKSKTTTKTTYTIQKLKKGKTYHVRIRAYKLDSKGKKVYGKWSGTKKIKVIK